MTTATLDRSTKKLTEQIYDLLKRDIIECKLSPGELLQEVAVRERYQIGHTPFREACHQLEAEGLIEIIPHRGYFVASFSNKDIRDLFELRIIVESLSVELACQRSRPDQFEALEKNLSEFLRLGKTKPPNLAQAINWNNMDFHLQVARLADNLELQSVIERIHNKLMRIIMFTARRTPENRLLGALHPDIFAAIKAGKVAEARKCILRDISTAQEWIRDFGR